MTEQALMKDGLGPDAVSRIAEAFSMLDSEFDKKAFTKACLQDLDSLELKQRVVHIIAQLEYFLGDDFERVAKLLLRLPEVWDGGDKNDPLSGFAAWPIIDYVSEAGIDQPALALACLETLTSLISAEFAIRSFIEIHPKITLKIFHKWIASDNEHVRRLVSEGLRPKLPWGKQLKAFIKNPKPIIPFLEKLKADESLYVRRSVANNLNDIAKDHAELVIDICHKWQREALAEKQDIQDKVNWVISHATRTLVKQGHPRSFTLLGYTEKPDINIFNFELSQTEVKIGKDLSFSIEIQANKNAQKFVLDYAVHYRKSNGNLNAKVFKLRNLNLDSQRRIKIDKVISFKKITTRRYYPGKHRLAILINGSERARVDFDLV